MYNLASPLFAVYLFVIGTAIGSFLNVLSDRLPREESIMGRSYCEGCNHGLAWYDMIPVLSYLFLRGKCRYCKTGLSLFYPLAELLTGVAFVLVWYFLPSNSHVVVGLSQSLITIIKIIYLVIISSLIVVFLSDLKYQIIPDSMQVMLLVSAVMLRLLSTQFSLNSLVYGAIEGVIIMAPMLLLYVLTKGKGMGFGDVKLAFVIGVLFGIKLGVVVLYGAFIFGALIGLMAILFGKKGMKSKIAFGPFLVFAMVVVLFYEIDVITFMKRIWGV